MSDAIITVEDLGKKYSLLRQRGERHTDLRDFLTEQAKNIFLRNRNGSARSREDFWAIKNLSFSVRKGEVLGIIGRNGAGKSTLLKLLSRITEPTKGKISVRGRVASLLEVGTGFHPELSGRENIFLNGAILGMTRGEIRKKFDEIVAFAETERFLDMPVKRYSSGMYVRLAFAVAAHLEPEVLIVDEVLAVGDSEFQKKCLGKIENVAKHEGRTVLFVSHTMSAIARLCTRTLLLSHGELVREGSAPEVIEAYFELAAREPITDLDALRYGDDRGVQILSISLAGRGDAVNYAADITFALEVRATRAFANLSIGSSIFREDNSCVGSLLTRTEFSISAESTVHLVLTYRKPMIAPGSYYAGFSVGTGGSTSDRNDLEVIMGTPHFRVRPVTSDNRALANWKPNWGSIVFENHDLVVSSENATTPAQGDSNKAAAIRTEPAHTQR